ncbi:MAG: putative LPS assembly protein LptD [Flammeovirgaceae bacterium]
MLLCASQITLAQDNEELDEGAPFKIAKDVELAANDSVNKTQGILDSMTVSYGKKGDIETTVVYFAKDSVRFDVINRIMYLYNEAKITYGSIILEAGYIAVDWQNFTLTAHALKDTSGRAIGIPIFTDDDQNYNADSIKYNFKTGKGIVKGIVTQQDDGFLQSDKAKRLPDGTLYNSSSLYTTCDLKEPHYAIHARKLKLNPSKNVVSGPFNLEINGIPTPVGFAFGMFPMPDKRNSGLIVPTYGESVDRGFFLRDGGFYWAVNDYLSMRFLGQIYSAGGWGTSMDANYKKRYAYSGTLNLSYNKVVRQGDAFDDDVTKDFWIKWNHAPVPRGTGRFSANVNFGTQTFNQNNSLNVDNFLSSTFSSSVSYSKSFPGTPFSLSTNIRHNQNVQTNVVKVFPEANLTMNRIFPLKKVFRSGSKSPLALLNFSYTFNSKMDLTNDIGPVSVPGASSTIQSDYDNLPDTIAFNFNNLSLIFDRSEYGAVHRIPISTQITLLKYFQFTPNLTYEEYWYPKRLNYEWDETEKAVRVTEENGFHRAYSFNTSVSARTTFYNFFYFKEKLPIRAIRQLITPSASFGYRPDFQDPKFDFYQNVQVDENGTEQTFCML